LINDEEIKMKYEIDLKETIWNALKEQREDWLKAVDEFPAFDDYTVEEYQDGLEEDMFSHEDILEEALFSLGLEVDDIDGDEFRDYQHETIELCVNKFELLKSEGE